MRLANGPDILCMKRRPKTEETSVLVPFRLSQGTQFRRSTTLAQIQVQIGAVENAHMRHRPKALGRRL